MMRSTIGRPQVGHAIAIVVGGGLSAGNEEKEGEPSLSDRRSAVSLATLYRLPSWGGGPGADIRRRREGEGDILQRWPIYPRPPAASGGSAAEPGGTHPPPPDPPPWYTRGSVI